LASLSIRDTDSDEGESVHTVGGNWHGSPRRTKDRQLLVDVSTMRVARSTLWHASSTITKGNNRGGRLSSALTRTGCATIVLVLEACDRLRGNIVSSSSAKTIPQAARRRGSLAPVDIITITSASRRALVAAALHASFDTLTVAVATLRLLRSLRIELLLRLSPLHRNLVVVS
jgi:TRAP-type uncharacterized transport system fused permease subunit